MLPVEAALNRAYRRKSIHAANRGTWRGEGRSLFVNEISPAAAAAPVCDNIVLVIWRHRRPES